MPAEEMAANSIPTMITKTFILDVFCGGSITFADLKTTRDHHFRFSKKVLTVCLALAMIQSGAQQTTQGMAADAVVSTSVDCYTRCTVDVPVVERAPKMTMKWKRIVSEWIRWRSSSVRKKSREVPSNLESTILERNSYFSWQGRFLL